MNNCVSSSLVDFQEVRLFETGGSVIVGKETNTDFRKHNRITINTEGTVIICKYYYSGYRSI